MTVTILRLVVVHDDSADSTQFSAVVWRPDGLDQNGPDRHEIYAANCEFLWEDEQAVQVRDEADSAFYHWCKAAGMKLP